MGWWVTLVSWNPTYPNLPDTTGPRKLFCPSFFHRIGPSGPIRSSSCDVRVYVCMCVCLSLLPIYALRYMFAPTSRSRMSKIFSDSESLGKSSGKKWSQNRTFLLGSGLKSSRNKKFFFADYVGLFQ